MTRTVFARGLALVLVCTAGFASAAKPAETRKSARVETHSPGYIVPGRGAYKPPASAPENMMSLMRLNPFFAMSEQVAKTSVQTSLSSAPAQMAMSAWARMFSAPLMFSPLGYGARFSPLGY